MRKIKVIIKRPDEMFGHVTNISDSLENLQKTVEGYIETVRLDENNVLICNEEGLLKHLPYNVTINGGMIVGTVIVAGTDGAEFADTTISLRQWRDMIREADE